MSLLRIATLGLLSAAALVSGIAPVMADAAAPMDTTTTEHARSGEVTPDGGNHCYRGKCLYDLE